MIDNEKCFCLYVILGLLINFYSAQQNLTDIDECTQWNASQGNILFDDTNQNNTLNDYSLNLMNSSLDINRQTGEIAVLDDRNHRVFIFDPLNTSVLLAILSDSSNSTIHNSPSAITFDRNNSFYVVDYNGTQTQLTKINMNLKYGKNATTSYTLVMNGTVRGLCSDYQYGKVYLSVPNRNQVAYLNFTSSPILYVGNRTAGNTSTQLNNPQSIVMDVNRTLYVNDRGNHRIQMFKSGSKTGTTLPININGCRGLSLYTSNILILNTKTDVHLFNLTNNSTRCIFGCQPSDKFRNISNAILDNNGSLVITNANQIISFPSYYQCLEKPTTISTIETSSSLKTPRSNITRNQGVFVPDQNCSNGKLGINCSFSNDICNLNQPCINSGTCFINNTNALGYVCQCPWSFNGTRCENDNRPCQFYTCFLHGTCINTSMTTYHCDCLPGYEGTRCETTINYCANVTCQNRAICSQQYLNYTCNCLAGFNGRHCEITETSAVIREYVVKSFGYIAIIMLASIIAFFVIMDVLKYVFGIDPVEADRKALKAKRDKNRLKQKKLQKKQNKQRPKVAYRFQYVN